MFNPSLTMVDSEIEKLAEWMNERDKTSGHDYTQQCLTIIRALRDSLDQAIDRIELLERRIRIDGLASAGRMRGH